MGRKVSDRPAGAQLSRGQRKSGLGTAPSSMRRVAGSAALVMPARGGRLLRLGRGPGLFRGFGRGFLWRFAIFL
jgi:hypothetical protein